MQRKGVHHIGLATLDIDRDDPVYTTSSDGNWPGWCDVIELPEGGRIKHAFIDTGDGTFFAFMCPEKVPGLPEEFATDINSAQGLPSAFLITSDVVIHAAALEQKREQLVRRGLDVTPVVDHEWCRSIYFKDPNGLLLEYCATVRKFNEDDKIMRITTSSRGRWSRIRRTPTRCSRC